MTNPTGLSKGASQTKTTEVDATAATSEPASAKKSSRRTARTLRRASGTAAAAGSIGGTTVVVRAAVAVVPAAAAVADLAETVAAGISGLALGAGPAARHDHARAEVHDQGHQEQRQAGGHQRGDGEGRRSPVPQRDQRRHR